MKWSITLMIAGILISLIGVVPPYFDGLTINALEVTASFLAVGILIFLVGLLIRKAKRALDATFQSTPPK